MRKIVFVLAMLIGFVSCEDDEGTTNTPNTAQEGNDDTSLDSSNLEGYWKVVMSQDVSGVDGETVLDYYDEIECDENVALGFSDNIVTLFSYDYSDVNGDCIVDESATEQVPFVFNSETNELFFVEDGEQDYMGTISFNNDGTQMIIDELAGEDYNQDGTEDIDRVIYEKVDEL